MTHPLFAWFTVRMDTMTAQKEEAPVDPTFALRRMAREVYPDGTPKYHGLIANGVLVVVDMVSWRYEPDQAPGVPLIELVA